MKKLKLCENIAFLRRLAGMTQEELAVRLGVTNQAVSKWESEQCCPDIALLPELAEIFDVSVDNLLGVRADASREDCSDTKENVILRLRERIDGLTADEANTFALGLASALHAMIISKDMTAPPSGNPGWDADGAIERAGVGEWGYSCLSRPELTTAMRGDTVIWSGNRALQLTPPHLRSISRIARIFGEPANLKAFMALYELTVNDEGAYAGISAVAERCGLAESELVERFDGDLSGFICEKDGGYRINGMYMYLPPVLTLLSFC